ncbi:pantetheine-phosphate adenylyltransferase family protein-like protein [Bisporella sp. PMI_857]|nr:pantetheine-phosphate adenylyltransferase family protein-like protein [Bisporella sp. PMI_857]
MPSSSQSLLLLPPPPSPPTPTSVSAAYRPSLEGALTILKGLTTSTELQIVLPCPNLQGRLCLPRSQLYSEIQQLLGTLYSLICLVCVKLGVEVDTGAAGAVDIRVILVYNAVEKLTANASPIDPCVSGPIIDLSTFSITRRKWNFVFAVNGEEGQNLLRGYLNLANHVSPPLQGDVRAIEGGVAMIQPSSIASQPTLDSTCHSVVAVGGTFDHIHAGHKLLLTATALLLQPTHQDSPEPRRLIVGITGDELLKGKKYAEYLNSWKQRQEDVIDFLLSILLFTRSTLQESIQTITFNKPVPNGRAIHTILKSSLITIECVEIQDPFGPTITDETVTALVVSGETRSGGQAVNDRRIEKGWKALDVFEVDVLDSQEHEETSNSAANFSLKISSTAIRKRIADKARTSSL